MSSTPEYRYTLDEAYLRVADARSSSMQSPRQRALARILPIALYLGITGWIGWRLRAQPAFDALCLVLVTIVYWFTVRKERRKAVTSLKGTPLENAIILVRLGPEGLEIEAGPTRARCTWESFHAARFFDDGLLLLDSPRSYRWLPHTGLSCATPLEVEATVREKVSDSTRIA